MCSKQSGKEEENRDIKLLEMKEAFFRGELQECDSKYQPILSGWEESRKMGADPHIILTDKQRDLHVFERIDDLSKCHLAYFKDYYESRNTALKKMGGAIFYLDSQLVAFHKDGNTEFLAYLKSKGIRIGTKLTVENVGVFAGNTAIGKPFSSCLSVGQGHFCDVLCEFACIARYGKATSSVGFRAVNLIILPLDKCFKNTINFASFLLEAGDFAYKNNILYPHIERRLHLLEQSAQYSTDIMLLVDDSGDIVFVNSRFENEFGDPIANVIGKGVSEKLPALSFCLKALRTGRDIEGQNVQIQDKLGNESVYYAEVQQIRENKTIIGVKLTLKTPMQIKKYAASANTEAAVYGLEDIIGSCPEMVRVKQKAKSAASVSANTLITGEIGTGKEMIARSIHSASSRAGMPFVTINCAALRRESVEEEFFGYAADPVHGAENRVYQGKFEQADGGTLFFDEISEMPLVAQSCLLRFVDEGRITRKDGFTCVHADVRIIASTNKDLLEMVENGMFKPELYYRLNIMRIDLPVLSMRGDDIELLINHFISSISEEYGKNVFSATPETISLLKEYSWPGNLRELHNVIERFVIGAEPNEPLDIKALPSDLRQIYPVHARLHDSGSASGLSFDYTEESRIRKMMLEYNGNKSKVAKALGVARGTLYKRLDEYGIGE